MEHVGSHMPLQSPCPLVQFSLEVSFVFQILMKKTLAPIVKRLLISFLDQSDYFRE